MLPSPPSSAASLSGLYFSARISVSEDSFPFPPHIKPGPSTLEVDGQTLKFKKCVVATGGSPRVPPIPGLKDVPYHTNKEVRVALAGLKGVRGVIINKAEGCSVEVVQ